MHFNWGRPLSSSKRLSAEKMMMLMHFILWKLIITWFEIFLFFPNIRLDFSIIFCVTQQKIGE